MGNQFSYHYAEEEPSEVTHGNITFVGCTEEQVTAIKNAGSNVYQQINKKGCLKDTGLENCFSDMSHNQPFEIKCDECEGEGRENEGGWWNKHQLAPTRPKPCRCVGSPPSAEPGPRERKNYPQYIGICKREDGSIPRTGCMLEEIMMHELLHGCGLDHEKEDDWQSKMFDACLKKCFPEGLIPDGYIDKELEKADPNDCKCPE